MKASALEFRLRFLVHGVIYTLGYWAPWLYAVRPEERVGFWAWKAVWLPAALEIERAGWMSLTGAANLLLGLGIFFAVAGAALRTWGAAYLGSAVVKDGGMHDAAAHNIPENNAGGVIADGPYRHLRNPLYVGTMLHTVAVSLLMPLSGAVFALVAIFLEQWRLIGGEEAFLEKKLGEPYLAYKRAVPRVLPAIRALGTGSGRRPQWPQAVLGEVYFWGVAVAFAAVGPRYNASLVIQGVVVAFGASLVARVFVPAVAKIPQD